ncbi:MAG: hypothetical protein KF824_11250 [Fimbriimonadaceae bacterium]|nr:MAG: hypothetical protein KF824_11250 [Fimbriimonadaceae bacterium]
MFTALVASIVFLQAAETPRDIRLPVMPISQFGTWLSKETGRQVIVLPEVADRLVYINVKKRTIPELLGFLKSAIAVGTIDSNGVLTLTDVAKPKDNAVAYKHLEKNLKAKLRSDFSEQKIEEVIKRVKEVSAKMSNDDNGRGWQEIEKLGKYDPGQMLLAEFVNSVGMNTILQLPLNERVVWSTSPTRLQRSWPGQSSVQLQKLNERLAIKNQVIQKLQTDEDEYSYYNQVTMPYGGLQLPVAGVQGIITRNEESIMISLKLFTKEGQQVNNVQDYVSGTYSEEDENAYEKYSTAYKDLEGEFPLTEADVKELERIGKLSFGYGQRTEFNKSDLEWCATVDQVEPMSGVASKIFDYACEKTGNEVVRQVFYPVYTGQNKKSIKASEAAMNLFVSYDFDNMKFPMNDLVVDQVANSSYADQYVPSRRAIATSARRILKDGVLTLDALADGVKFLTHPEQIPQFVTGIVNLSGQSSSNMYISPYSWEAFIIQAYANLNPQQRKAVWSEAGLALDLNRAPQALQRLYADTILKCEVQIGSRADEFYYEMQSFEEDPSSSRRPDWPPNIPNNSWMREQTVFLTMGQSQPITIKLSAGTDQRYLIESKYSDWSYTRTSGIDQLASTIVFSEAAKKQGVSNYENIASVGICKESTVKLTLGFGQFPAHEAVLKFLAEPPGKMGSVSDLPEDQRKILDEKVEKMRKEYGDIQFGGPPGKTIKP